MRELEVVERTRDQKVCPNKLATDPPAKGNKGMAGLERAGWIAC